MLGATEVFATPNPVPRSFLPNRTSLSRAYRSDALYLRLNLNGTALHPLAVWAMSELKTWLGNALHQESFLHSLSVTAIAQLIDPSLKLQVAGLVHDIGKCRIPGPVMYKRGKPDHLEWALIQTHPAESVRLLQRFWLPEEFSDLLEIVFKHHELLDASGYPRRLSGREICWLTRVLTVADIIDALIRERSYKEAMPVREALAFMYERFVQTGKIDAGVFSLLEEKEDQLCEIARVMDADTLERRVRHNLRAASTPLTAVQRRQWVSHYTGTIYRPLVSSPCAA
jgi:hypothetical protein